MGMSFVNSEIIGVVKMVDLIGLQIYIYLQLIVSHQPNWMQFGWVMGKCPGSHACIHMIVQNTEMLPMLVGWFFII